MWQWVNNTVPGWLQFGVFAGLLVGAVIRKEYLSWMNRRGMNQK